MYKIQWYLEVTDILTNMEKTELRRIRTNFRLAAAAALIVLSAGTTFYHFVEKLSWVDAFYFSTITLTTVGYGDITPHTTLGKLFTCAYVVIGIAIIGAFGNLLIKTSMVRREQRQEKSDQPEQ